MNSFEVLRTARCRAALGAVIAVVLVLMPLGNAAYADVGPCSGYIVSVNNLPPGHFNFDITVNFKYKMQPSDPWSYSSNTHTIQMNGNSSGGFLNSLGQPIGAWITSVDMPGGNVPADGSPHVVPSGIPGVCDTVVIDLTRPPANGQCPIIIDIHPGSC